MIHYLKIFFKKFIFCIISNFLPFDLNLFLEIVDIDPEILERWNKYKDYIAITAIIIIVIYVYVNGNPGDFNNTPPIINRHW